MAIIEPTPQSGPPCRRITASGAGVEPRCGGQSAPAAAGLRRLLTRPKLVGALIAFDLLAFPLAGALAWAYAIGPWPETRLLCSALALVGSVAVVALFYGYAYTLRAMAEFARQASLCAGALAFALALMLALAVLTGHGGAPGLRNWALDWFVAAWALGGAARAGLAWLI